MSDDEIQALKRTNLGLILEIRRLKERRKERGEGDLPEETTREKAMREARFRLKDMETGSPEHQSELAKITADHGPLIAAEVADVVKGYQTRLESQRATVAKLVRNAEAQQLANRLARPGSASALQQLIVDRIQVDVGDDEPVVRYRGLDGADTTLDELTRLLINDPALAPLFGDARGVSAAAAESHERRVAATLARPVETRS